MPRRSASGASGRPRTASPKVPGRKARDFKKWRPLVHVFIPYAKGKDGVWASPEYDTPSFRAELPSWFAPLGLGHEWCEIRLGEVEARLGALGRGDHVVFNLCDGNEGDGFPGLSVVEALAQSGIPFTGADADFYRISTSKLAMKECFVKAGVPTTPYRRLDDPKADIAALARQVGYPAILKFDRSANGMGLGRRSVVVDEASARAQLEALGGEGVYAERYVEGREFTALVLRRGGMVYPAVEMVFDQETPPLERILFEGHREARPATHPHCRYALAPAELQDRLAPVARAAFAAVGGRGYGRVDMRYDVAAGQVYVLEVNANCALSRDEPSLVAGIDASHRPFHRLIEDILHDAFDAEFT
ncbi:MAG TPA: hypothetical protein VKT70_09775 [Stellaceae bacterium]|nr:hypothetical protein [Stellaceae bacterium]